MITKINQFVNNKLDDIILVIVVILISLFSFSIGYIAAKIQEKEPIKIEDGKNEQSTKSSYYRGRNLWSLFSMEASKIRK